MNRCSLACLLSLAWPTDAAAQAVIVVDEGGGGDFTVLQAAVDAAAPGDVILLRSTQWDLFFSGPTIIDGKGLTVIGDGVQPSSGPLLVRNVPAAATVTLRNLRAFTSAPGAEGIALSANLGTVFLEEVYSSGAKADAPLPPASAGLLVEDCDSVVLNGCTIFGGYGVTAAFISAKPGAPGLVAVNSQISATRTSFHGGAGGESCCGGAYGRPGGHGIDMTGGFLHLAGATVAGGINGECPNCDGSDGLHVQAGLVHFEESTFAAGVGSSGPPGQDVDAVASQVVDLQAEARVLAVPSPLRSFEDGTLKYTGAPFDLVAVFVSAGTSFLPLPAKSGVWQLASPLTGPLPLGHASATGTLQLTVEAPDITPLQGLVLFVQSVAKEAGATTLHVGGPSTLVVVDDAF